MANYVDIAMKAISKQKKGAAGMSPGRRETLEAVLDAILLQERDEVIRGGVWKPTDGTRKAEERLDRLYHDILDGRGKLADFAKGCRWWRESGTNISPGLPGI